MTDKKLKTKFTSNLHLTLGAIIGLVIFVTGIINLAHHGIDMLLFSEEQLRYESYCRYEKMYTSPELIAEERIPSEEEIKKCEDEYVKREKVNRHYYQTRNLLFALVLIIIGLPLWLMHLKLLRKKE